MFVLSISPHALPPKSSIHRWFTVWKRKPCLHESTSSKKLYGRINVKCIEIRADNKTEVILYLQTMLGNLKVLQGPSSSFQMTSVFQIPPTSKQFYRFLIKGYQYLYFGWKAWHSRLIMLKYFIHLRDILFIFQIFYHLNANFAALDCTLKTQKKNYPESFHWKTSWNFNTKRNRLKPQNSTASNQMV